MKKRMLIGLALLISVVAACGHNQGESAADDEWEPKKAIEIVAPAGAGGGWDTTARMAAEVFEQEGIINKGIAVVNKEGGGGAVGWSYIAGKKGNPHHLFVASPPLLLVPLNGQAEYEYDDFTPIANLISDYAAFAVRADAEWEDLNDLFEDMKENPSSVTVIGESAPGSMDHIQFAKIARAAGVDITQIKYVSAQDGSAMTNLLNGNADVYSTGVTETVEQVRAGEIKVLAVTSEERLKGDVIEDFETAKEQGIDETFINWRGFFGPPDIDESALTYYEAKFKELNESQGWKDIRDKYGWNEKFMGSDAYKSFLAEEEKAMKELLDELGLSSSD